MPSDQDHSELFNCTKCGDCCKGFGGTYVTDADIDAIAAFVGVERRQFIERFCELSGGQPLIAQAASGYCVFWETVCTIHPVKPRMCKAWPFIDGIVKDVTNWHIMAASCPGMRTDVPDDQILGAVRKGLKQRSEVGAKSGKP
jgi:Fe-S-cluster containining protein